MKEEKNIGRMIYELENDLELCRQAEQIINGWKNIYKFSNDSKRYALLTDILTAMGFSPEEIQKILIK